MNEKEIRAKYEAQVCATQMEFDRIMSEMNTEQTHLNHPYLDRERELAKQKELLEQQKQAITDTVSTVFPSICHEVLGPDAMVFVF